MTADLISGKRCLICPMIKSEEKTWECTNGLFLSSAASLSKQSVSGPQTELSKSSDSAVKSRTAKCDYGCCHCLILTTPLSMDPQCPEDENKILLLYLWERTVSSKIFLFGVLAFGPEKIKSEIPVLAFKPGRRKWSR